MSKPARTTEDDNHAVGRKSPAEMADRSTPLMRNHWYVAAWAEEVTRTPLRRQILGDDIVLYRTEAGQAVALHNRCAHRSFPLSRGILKGDRIVCAYHGIEFNPDGSCGWVPSLQSAPRAMRVPSYPLVEQGPFVWIWMGNPDKPDNDKLVQQPWFTGPDWNHVTGYCHMKANYLGLHENLLDLSHFPFVHGAAVGKAEHAEARPKVRVEGNVVHASVLHRDVVLAPEYAAATALVAPIDRLSEQQVPSPAIHVGKAILTDSSDPPQTHLRYIVHCPTPETQTSTHYFWAIARNHALGNERVDAESRAFGAKAFNEDREVLEAIEELVARDGRDDFREKIIRTDEGAILLLRAFARMAAEEVAAHPGTY